MLLSNISGTRVFQLAYFLELTRTSNYLQCRIWGIAIFFTTSNGTLILLLKVVLLWAVESVDFRAESESECGSKYKFGYTVLTGHLSQVYVAVGVQIKVTALTFFTNTQQTYKATEGMQKICASVVNRDATSALDNDYWNRYTCM